LLVKVDTDLMKQAILNIVLNGVQAMGNGGTLTIHSRRSADNVITEIRDEGTGIPPEVQDKMFELYFTTKKGGSGIGLAETTKILQWHYGTVEFESLEGRGTTFRMCLPLTEGFIRGDERRLAAEKDVLAPEAEDRQDAMDIESI
jgi:signal transduction histidine kinase